MLVPVWDIGVEGEHEFVAEGVVVHNCYKDTSNPVDGWLTPEFIEQKKREIPKEMWRVEYELGEPSIGTRAFDYQAVERMFGLDNPDHELQPHHIVKEAQDYYEYKFDTYHSSKEYVIGADWAKAEDFTVITVWRVDTLPIQLQYLVKMRRRPYPVMIKQYNTLMNAWHAEGIHDATGLGGVVADYLDERAYGFKMTGEKRDNMLSDYVNAVEKDAVRAHMVPWMYRSHLYASVDDLYARGKDFHLPDDICSAALAWHLVSRRGGIADPVAMERLHDSNWMAREIEENREKINQRKSEWGRVGEVVKQTHPDEDPENSLLV